MAKQDYVNLVPDYYVEQESLIVNPRFDAAQETVEGEHPLETMAKPIRAKNDVYTQLTSKQVLLTNLPDNFNELKESKSIQDFLHKNVHRDLDVKKVDYISSLGTRDMAEKIAYVKVTLGSKSQAQMVQKRLRKTWISDCLLKVKTAEDAKREHFNNRTVVLSNIPRYLSTEKAMEAFGKNAGKIVGIELPKQKQPWLELSVCPMPSPHVLPHIPQGHRFWHK